MRRRFAEGLAVLLSVASLGAGAASGPSLEAAKVSKPWVTVTAKEASGHASKSTKKPAYQVGTASWYGDYFQGKQTASGEPYNMNDLTAAHPSLPLGTFVKVTNLRNGKAVVVRINDRGPVVDGRIIDVSYNAAQALGFKERGLQKVRLDISRAQTVAKLEPVANLN
jgi:rare lipoprotein A